MQVKVRDNRKQRCTTSKSPIAQPIDLPNSVIATSLQRAPGDSLSGNPKTSEGIAHFPTDMKSTTEPIDDWEEVNEFSTSYAQVLATPSKPVNVKGDGKIRTTDLFAVAPNSRKGFVPITKMISKYENIAADGLYIDNAPHPDEVRQGMLGDCWDLAVVASIAAQDPGTLEAMMGLAGTNFSASFFRQVPVSAAPANRPAHTYQPTVVSVPTTLAKESATGGLKFSQMKHGTKQYTRQGFVESVKDGVITLRIKQTWEVARWAPLLEKAFARFAETYGAYGGSGTVAKDETTGRGYRDIDGGSSYNLLPVFYGDEGEQAREFQSTIYSTSGSLASLNAGVIAQLATLQGTDPSTPAANQKAAIVTATSSSPPQVQRLSLALSSLLASSDLQLISIPTRVRLRELLAACQAIPPGQKPDERVIDRAQAVVHEHDIGLRNNPNEGSDSETRVNDGQELLDLRTTPGASKMFSDIVELCLDLASMNSRTTQRQLFPEHEYTVVSAAFADRKHHPLRLPSPLPVDQPTRQKLLDSIDDEMSFVRLRNPHASNGPDRHGTTDPERPEGDVDGYFWLNLRSFLVNVGSVTSLVIDRKT